MHTGVFYVHFAPFQVQSLTVVTAIAAAATVVEVGHGEAALGPVLNARVEHRVTGGGWAAVDKDHQRRFDLTVHRRVEKTVGLAAGRGIAQCLRTADLLGRQRRNAASQHIDMVISAVNADHR